MTCITFTRHRDRYLFECEGHTGYSKRGCDILCSAVSCLCYTLDAYLQGAYEDGKCIGVAIYQDHWLKHMYLYDLKVNAAARGKGVGKLLIQAGLEAAKNKGYRGLYTYAQDNNLNACMFYLKAGFQIGGFDNHVYNGTSQEGKADVIFYLT